MNMIAASWIRPQRRPILIGVSWDVRGLSMGAQDLRITKVTNENLTNNNTSNLHVVDSGNPRGITDRVVAPAFLEGGLEKGGNVGDGEQHVTIDVS